ncbi:MAG: ABC transporter permease [Candidatus Hodarchaeales archaeon]|jgi:ABC-type Fe3+ transport system permease subunit
MVALTKNRFFKGLKSDLDPLSTFLLLSVLFFFTIFLVIPVVAILSTAFIVNGQFSFEFFVNVFKNPIYFELEIGSFVFLSIFALTLFFASRFMKKFQDKTFTISDLVIPLIYTIISMSSLFLFSDALTSIPQFFFGMIIGLLFLGIGFIINKVKNVEFGNFVASSILPTLLLLVGLPSLGFLILVLLAILCQLTNLYESIGLGDITLLAIIITIILGLLISFIYSRRFSKNYLSSSFLKPFLWLAGACIFVIGPFFLNNYDMIVGGWQFNFYKKIADPQYGYIIVISGLEASVLINTIFVAIATTFFSAVMGVFFAFVIARYEFFGKSFIRVLLLVPLVVPPFVGAIGIKRMLAHPQGYSFFNRLFYDAIPILQYPIIIKGLTAVILVQSVHFYTLVYLNSLSAFQNIDPTLEESGENLGASGSRLFRSITLPLAIPGIAAGSILTFILSVEDLGTPLIFTGDTEIQNLLTTKVFALWQDQLGTLQGDGLALAVILFLIAMTGFAFIRKYVGIKEYAMVSKGGVFNPRIRQISKKATVMIILSVAALMSFALLPHFGSFLLAVSDNFTWTVTNPEHLLPTALSFKLLSPDIGDLIRVIGIPLSWILGWFILFLLYKYLRTRIKFPDSSTNPLASNSLLIFTIILPILVSTIVPETVRIFIPSLHPLVAMFNIGIGKLVTDTIGQIGNLTNIEFLYYIMEEGGFSDVITRTTIYALIAMILIILLGIAAAYVLARKEFPGKFAFDTLVTSPIAIPGIIIGFGLFTYYIPLLVNLFGSEIQINELIPGFYVVHFLLIASFTVRRFPFTVRAAYAGLQQTHKTFEEASTNLGATNLQTILKITLPLIAMNVLAGAMISFVYSLGEVSTALILITTNSQATIPWMINEKNVDPLPHAGILGVNEAAALGVLLVLLQVIIITISNRILKSRGSALTGI